MYVYVNNNLKTTYTSNLNFNLDKHFTNLDMLKYLHLFIKNSVLGLRKK